MSSTWGVGGCGGVEDVWHHVAPCPLMFQLNAQRRASATLFYLPTREDGSPRYWWAPGGPCLGEGRQQGLGWQTARL